MENIYKICKVEGCNDMVKSRDLCEKHYARLRRYGRLERAKSDKDEIGECIAFDCKNEILTSGLCEKHYKRLCKTGSVFRPKVIKLCEVEGCNKPHIAKGLCHRHYQQFQKRVEKHKLTYLKVGKM